MCELFYIGFFVYPTKQVIIMYFNRNSTSLGITYWFISTSSSVIFNKFLEELHMDSRKKSLEISFVKYNQSVSMCALFVWIIVCLLYPFIHIYNNSIVYHLTDQGGVILSQSTTTSNTFHLNQHSKP